MVVVGLMLLPAPAESQGRNRDNKWTREAGKFIGLAMTRPDRAGQRPLYQQALDAVKPGLAEEPDNAKVWFVAGQAYVGVGDYGAADTCFDRAISIAKELEADIDAEREQGWMAAFEEGVALMDQQQYEQALAVLEASERLYAKRPEALLNIGSIYARLSDLDKAEDAFRRAAEAAQGPLLAQLDSAAQLQWKSYVEMANLNIAQMRGSRGVDAFTAAGETTEFQTSVGHYQKAADWFHKAAEMNPYSRDYLFNYVQARYALATEYEEHIQSTPAELERLRPLLIELYAAMPAEIEKVRAFDPTSESLALILARAQRRHGELSGDSMKGREAALATLTTLEQMPVEIVELSIAPGDSTATLAGKVKNRTLAAGTPVTIKVTLLDLGGGTIGEMTFTVNTGDKESQTPFEQSGEIRGQIAGWKYVIST
jgi:tetratricopeptide (TPR) repeat protein